MKKTLKHLALTLLLWTVLTVQTNAAPYLNMGTLDVKPVTTSENQNPDWFIEYLNPGEQKQGLIQISNFSNTQKNLQLYVTDTHTNTENQFYTKRIEENPTEISQWVHLPVETLTLGPGESRILSTNFILPKNAGVGLHTGAIMAREIVPATDPLFKDLAIEKGIRIYLNVTGPAISNGNIQNIIKAETPTTYAFNIESTNQGTTDYKKTYSLELKDLFGNLIAENTAESKTKPKNTESTVISVEKPNFGLYTTTLTDQNHTYFSQTTLFIPFWSLLITLLILVGILAVQIRPKSETPFIKSILQQNFNTPVFQRSTSYLLLLTLTATLTFTFANFNLSLGAHTDIKPISACCYELTIKWGDFRDIRVPKDATNEWHGRILFKNAHVSTTDLLHFERTDKAEIAEEDRALRFDLQTGPDNDGVLLKVSPTSEEIPVIKYEDYVTNQTFEFPITSFIDAPGTFPAGIFGIYFKTEPLKEKVSRTATSTQLLGELPATPDLEASPSISPLPELQNLFIEELPATPEVLTDFILESDYVEHITDLAHARKFETDSILLKAFEATPEIIEILSATPDLNYLFIPSETILFPPLEFSFEQEKVTTQELGTLIFVQNKGTPWNTFVSTTDFQLLSGTTQIPASYITINPGEPEVLLQLLETNGEQEKIFDDKIFKKELAPEIIEPETNPTPVETVLLQPESEKTESADPESDNKKDKVNGKDKAPGQNKEEEIPPSQAKIKDEKDKVKSGDKKAFSDKEDKNTLVEVEESENKIIFVLHPTIEIRIPPATPAGTYQGMLTITSV